MYTKESEVHIEDLKQRLADAEAQNLIARTQSFHETINVEEQQRHDDKPSVEDQCTFKPICNPVFSSPALTISFNLLCLSYNSIRGSSRRTPSLAGTPFV
jgi:hypothetical protein